MPAARFPFHLEALPRSAHLRIGLLGGSFNPPHAGHLHIAKEAKRRLGLDRVLWLVSPQNPLKARRDTPPQTERLTRCEAMLAREGGIHASGIEARMGTRFTIDTLRRLRRRWPKAQFVWLMGTDNLAGFHRWKAWREIARLCPMAVIERPPSPYVALKSKSGQWLAGKRLPETRARALPGKPAPAWVLLAVRRHAASSTALRRQAV